MEKIKSEDEEVASEGSSLDPEHFQLKEEEEIKLWDDRMEEDDNQEQCEEKSNEVLIVEGRNKIDRKI